MACVLRGTSCDWRRLSYTDSLLPYLRFPPLSSSFSPSVDVGVAAGGEFSTFEDRGAGLCLCNGLPYAWFLLSIHGCL